MKAQLKQLKPKLEQDWETKLKSEGWFLFAELPKQEVLDRIDELLEQKKIEYEVLQNIDFNGLKIKWMNKDD